MDKSGFRNLLKKYTKEIKKELSELKVIGDTDIEKKSDDVDFAYHKHFEKLNDLIRAKPNSVSRIDPDLTKYEILLKELQDLQSELTHKVLEKRNQKQKEQQNKDYQLKSSHCSYCKKKPPTNYYIYSTKNKELKSRKRTTDPYKKEYLFCSETHFEKWHKKNYYTCAECNKEFYDGNYKYNKKQSDSQKFCSDNCYYQHYAETCDNCLEKCVSSYKGKVTGLAQTYYSDAENKTGTLCSKCHQEQLKEEAEEKKKDKEWEENFKKLDKNMDDLVDGMVEAVGNNDNDSDDVNNSNNNNSYREREREREREQIQTNMNNLQSDITNLESLIPTNPESQAELEAKKKKLKELETKLEELNKSLPIDAQISNLQQEIKQLENKSTRTKAEEALLVGKKEELEKLLKKQSNATNNAKPSDKTALYVGCGIFGVVLIGLVFILVRRSKRKSKY